MESDSLHEYDKSWKAFFITTLFILCTVNAYAQSSDTIFSRYFRYAQNFADAYPREKVSLHLDNASYYLGDTIWFKAYVVTAVYAFFVFLRGLFRCFIGGGALRSRDL